MIENKQTLKKELGSKYNNMDNECCKHDKSCNPEFIPGLVNLTQISKCRRYDLF
jgi:hypothetical protein